MYEAIILRQAKQDISDAAQWYNSKKKGLGRRFTKEVRSIVKFICKNPETFEIRYDDTRCAILKVFPYMVHYTINKKDKAVIIAAVFHTSLSPDQWKKR